MEATVTDLRQQVDEAHERLKAEIPPLEEGGSRPIGTELGVPVEDLRVDGTAQLGLFQAGGKAPTGATLALSGKIELMDGKAYRKGDRIYFEGVAVIRGVSQKDKVDKATGVVTECAQGHTAEITDLVVRPAGVDGEAA